MSGDLKQKLYLGIFARGIVAALVLMLFFTPALAETNTETPSAVTPPADFVGPPVPKDLPALAEPTGPPASAAVVSGGKEEDLLLQLIINDAELEDVVEALRRDGKLYLPIGQLSGILDFPITVDPVTKTAKGWFIRQQNTLTLSEQSGGVKGKSVKIPPGSVFSRDAELYVDSDLLHEWMPLDFSVDMRRMTLGITAREALPFQARDMRDKKRQALAQRGVAVKDQTFKKLDIPYEAAQWPTVDLTISPSYDSTNKGLRTDYSALAVGDFGYLTSRLYAAGNMPDDNLSDLRLSFGRDDYEKKLLGFMKASSFRFGDINSASLTQVATPLQGRGFTVTNRELQRPDNFDVTNFIGDSKPGWEVELYRNGTLIDFQTVGQDGRYNFRAVPILFGNNQFRLAFYGPQGQVEEITRTVNAAESLMEKGQVSYNFSADEKNKSLFGVSDQTSATNPAGFAAAGEMEYGATKWLTVAAGGAHTVLTDGEHNYATAGLRASVQSVLASLDGAYDLSDSTYSTRLSLSTEFHGTLVSAQQKFARRFFSEENATLTNPINRQSVLRVDRQFGDLGASLSYTRNGFDSGRLEQIWTNQISKPLFGGMTFTNTLRYDKDNLGLDQLNGSAFLRGYFARILLGAQADYQARPVRQLDTVKLDGVYPFSPTINDRMVVTRQVSGARSTQVENTATFDLKRYKLSVTGRANDDGDYFAGLTFNMSIGRVPDSGKWILSSKTLAETGTVAVIPYIDHNYNQLRDADEKSPPSSSIRIGNQTIKVDKHGTAIASQLATNLPVSVRIDPENQQASPLWTAGVDEYKVVPRAGKIITVPLPVFETSQIDGTVSAPSGVSPQNLVVELANADGQVVRTTHTAFDGYYLLEGVMPGAYKIRVSQESLSERKLRQDDAPSLTITVSDFFIKDIHLVDAGAPASGPPFGPPMPGSAAIVPPNAKRDEEEASAPKWEPVQTASADGPPMPKVKPEDVATEPLSPDAAALVAAAQPEIPAAQAAPDAPQAQDAVSPAPVSPRKSLLIVNEAAPAATDKQPHIIIVNNLQPPAAGPQQAHKPSLVIVNDSFQK
ncbi:MAG: hypothetical protein EPN97_16180 [Alphaproteobacteria bacterium]|nr:MAG: hypothetical protein EPN97_16180 [Alphaproteobacteria bacterium]